MVDPQRDIDRVITVAGRLNARIVLVLKTHVHNDYPSGGLEPVRRTGAEYGFAAADEVPVEHRPLREGDVVEPSEHVWIQAVATPGHTYYHLPPVAHSCGQPAAGGCVHRGALLFGTTGRTDLLGEEHKPEPARQQYDSVRNPAETLPDGVGALR